LAASARVASVVPLGWLDRERFDLFRSHTMPMQTLRATLCFTLLCAGVLAAGAGHAAVYRVGEGCTYELLGQALAASAGDPQAEIRMRSGVYHIRMQSISNRSVVVRGGYDSCTAAAPGGSATTLTMDPSWISRGRTLFVSATTPGHHVVLERLEITGLSYWAPDTPLPSITSGGIEIRGPLEATLRHVTFYASHDTSSGGAIRIYRDAYGSPQVRVEDSLLAYTSAQGSGGGINCANATLELDRVTIEGGHAGNSGGGVHATNCAVTARDSVVRSNVAGLYGGGVNMVGSGGSTPTLDGERLTFRGNTAPHAGGGLRVISAVANLANNRFVANNSSAGAALLSSESAVTLRGRGCSAAESTAAVAACSTIAGHQLGAQATVVSVISGSLLELFNTTVLDNTAPWILRAHESHLDVRSAAFVRNVGANVLWLLGNNGHTYRLTHVSMSGNSPSGGHVRAQRSNPSVVSYPIVAVLASAFSGNGRPLRDGGSDTNLTYDCFVTDQNVTGIRVLWADPNFAADGIHLTPGSLAVDYCTPLSLAGPTDVDGRARVYDHPDKPEAAPGTFADAGAHELFPAELFADGFESGGLGSWSSANP
jgi:hypothetical protein